jgi:hypothetical protein
MSSHLLGWGIQNIKMGNLKPSQPMLPWTEQCKDVAIEQLEPSVIMFY